MNEKLIIKNFGPIVDMDLEIHKTIVFIGPQSSGKSTVAKVLAIFRTLDPIVNETKINDLFLDYNIDNYFHPETYFNYKNKDYEITCQGAEFVITKTEDFKTAISTEKERINKLINNLVEERYKDDTPEQKKATIDQIYEYNWRFLFQLLKTQLYIPAERILTSLISEAGFSFNGISLPGCLKEFGKQFENSRVRIKELEIPYLNITYKYEESGENKGPRIYFDETNSISLSESSSGIQSVVPIQVVIESVIKREMDYSFIVEEPELNLFPTAQKSIINYLIAKCNQRNELVITTHSPYVLSVLNNLIFASNVASANKSNKITNSDIANIIPENLWINSQNFNAYYLAEGKAKSIVNPVTQLIFDNELDKVSQDIIGERDSLIELYKKLR